MTARRPARTIAFIAAILVLGAGTSCDRRDVPPRKAPFVPGTEVVICGERLDIGTPVVLWNDPIGFDAYLEKCRYSDQILPSEAASRPDPDASPLRYGERSKKIASVRDLATAVHLAVIHYDAVGSSERCFRALHDNRGLSAHFLLDLDGTLYQTLDLRERAFHAKDANDESIGIEIANIGAMSTPKLLEAWYGPDESGAIRNRFPPEYRLGEQRRRDVILRPARQELISGTIHGAKFVQYDFTNEQYTALAQLLGNLNRVLPRIRLEAPRDRRGRVPNVMIEGGGALRFEGLVGHHHLDERKYDPGPAFDWDRLIAEARRVLEKARERK